MSVSAPSQGPGNGKEPYCPSADVPQAEVEGEKDAVAEENAPQTPAAEGEEPVAAEAAADVAEEEPEEVQKSLDQYLAERAAAALAVGKKEARQVSADTLEGQAFRREAIDEFFSGKVGRHSCSALPCRPTRQVESP